MARLVLLGSTVTPLPDRAHLMRAHIVILGDDIWNMARSSHPQLEATPAGSCIARAHLWHAAYVRRNRPPDQSVAGPANLRVHRRGLSLMRQGP